MRRRQMGYWPVALKDVTQLVGQKIKAIIKLANASWRNIFLGIKRKKTSPFSQLEDYY